MLRLFPEIGIEANKHFHQIVVPYPREVVCQLEQTFESGRNRGINGIGLNRSYHRKNPSKAGGGGGRMKRKSSVCFIGSLFVGESDGGPAIASMKVKED
jgi:hypothetical protein